MSGFPKKVTFEDKQSGTPLVDSKKQLSAQEVNDLKKAVNDNALFYGVEPDLATLQEKHPNPPKGAFAYIGDGKGYRSTGNGWKPDVAADMEIKFQDLEKTVQSISAGEGGKSYATLAAAQAVDPKPQDGTIFQVEEAANAGYWKFDSTQTGGTKFVRSYKQNPIFKSREAANTGLLERAIDKIWIEDPDVNKVYTLSVVIRNYNGNSQLSVYESSPDFLQKTEVFRIDIAGDPANGKFNILEIPKKTGSAKTCYVRINWNLLPDPTNLTQQFSGYELSGYSLSKENSLALVHESKRVDTISQNELFRSIPEVYAGFVDVRTGGISSGAGYFSTGYIDVYEGQQIQYTGKVYGNAGICGYDENKGNFVVLYDPNVETEKYNFIIEIPSGVAYLRASLDTTSGVENIVLQYSKGSNYEYLKKIVGGKDALKLNIVPDPYFKFGEFLIDKGVNPNIDGFGSGNLARIDGETLIVESSKTTAKGMNIMAYFEQDWASKFGLSPGDTIRFGCYVKFEYGQDATLMNWGSNYNPLISVSETTYTPNSQLQPLGDVPLSDFVWIERTVALKSDGTDINQPTWLSLAYLQIEDPSANITPTKMLMKKPCILFNPSPDDTGFFETSRDILGNFEAVKTTELNVEKSARIKNIETNERLEVKSFNQETEKMTTRWIELKYNKDFPSSGVFLGRDGNDIVLSVDGVKTKLNNI